jgi:hypothetical protein
MQFAMEEEWSKYLTKLWEMASKQKRIKITMNKKRSNIYSVLKNTFMGKVKRNCTATGLIIIHKSNILTLPAIYADAAVSKLVLPTLESMPKQIICPRFTTYYFMYL